MSPPLTPEQVDQLAREGLYVLAEARKDLIYDYDITGYRRVERRDTPFGQFTVWDGSAPTEAVSPGRHPECALDCAYVTRLGGLVRGRMFTPDQVGELLRDKLILHCDGPGNGKYESMMIARKFGLRVAFEVAPWKLPLPITRPQMAAFRTAWERQVIYIRDYCRRLELALGVKVVDDPDQLWIVLAGLDIQPLDVFIERVNENFAEVNADFRQEYGFDLPLDAPRTPLQIARRAKLWEYIRGRSSELARLQTEVFRRHLRGRLVSNLEFDTEVDWKIWGEAYDIPGVNMRVALFDDEIGYRYWVGYGTRLTADLTHHAPMISVRTNQVAAGPRVVPSRAATREWYSQAVQNGAMGFFVWIQDFLGDQHDPQGYAGPCMANPDPSTHPRERWETHLEVSQQLGRTRVFQPPHAETGILVPIAACAAGQWPGVFSAYVEASRARVFARFVSSAELREDDSPLSGLRLLFVPRAIIEHSSVVSRLWRAVEAGLTLVVSDATCFTYDENGDRNERAYRLMGIDGAEARATNEPVLVTLGDETCSYSPYLPGLRLVPSDGTRVVGRFRDGEIAVVEHAVRAGKVLTFGAPILDLYAAGVRSLADEDQGRCRLLSHLHRCSTAADHSWVFDVRLENLSEVTGPHDVRLPDVDHAIEFAPFMLMHGDTMG